MAALEGAGVQTARPESRASVVAPAPESVGCPGELDEELIAVISSAIAAFLGKKPHIRQIRLIGSAAWAQQGRVTIQASHALSAYSGRS